MDEDRVSRWRTQVTAAEIKRFQELKKPLRTASGIEVKDIYTSNDVNPNVREELPGEYPLTRGIYGSMYRNRPFTRRQVVGLGTAVHANERHRFVLAQGQTGLSNDFDLPTLTGYDFDDERVTGDVGRIGVAIDTVHDMDDLLAGIPLDAVSTSMTINHPAPVLLAMYLAVADQRGVPWDRLKGTVQNDGLKEFFAQKTFAIPPAPALRMVTDVIEFCARNVPKWNPISLCGYQTRDCGGTADQEIGFTFAAAKTYIDETLKRGVDIDDFAPQLSFLMYIHMDFLEEVAKFRAARRLWARRCANTMEQSVRSSGDFAHTYKPARLCLPHNSPKITLRAAPFSALQLRLEACNQWRYRHLTRRIQYPRKKRNASHSALSKSWHLKPVSLVRPIRLVAVISSSC